MRLARPFQVLGVVTVGLIALAVGTRPALRAQQPTASIAPVFVGGAFGGSNAQEPGPKDPPVYLPAPAMTVDEAKTRLKLHDRVSMQFPDATPLSDVIKFLEEITIDKADFPEGLSIYVDPQGLQDADQTLQSTIAINLKRLPLETVLELTLKQLNLTYWVNKDGLLIITAASDDLITPNSLDHEILSSLSKLRHEIHSLRDEVRSLRGGGLPQIRAGVAPAGGAMGGVGGMM